jgi:hypothetical protein
MCKFILVSVSTMFKEILWKMKLQKYNS